MDELTDQVVASFAATADPRFREVMTALVRHLHAFAREVGLTEEEYFAGIDFLTRTGQISTDTRNIRVQATIQNPDKILKPGMFATTTITLPPTVPPTPAILPPTSPPAFTPAKASAPALVRIPSLPIATEASALASAPAIASALACAARGPLS